MKMTPQELKILYDFLAIKTEDFQTDFFFLYRLGIWYGTVLWLADKFIFC